MTGSDMRIAATVAALREAAERAGLNISPTGRVTELSAALLIGVSRSGLKKMRAEERSPTARRVPFDNCSVSYALTDIAAWMIEKSS